MPRTKNTPLTSAELLKQSEALRRQAEELKRKEIPEVVARMKEAIAHYGLTATDLGLAASVAKAARPAKKQGKAEAPAAAVPKKAAKKPATIKYRDGAGHTWSGYGPKPKWLKDALAAGASDESLRA